MKRKYVKRSSQMHFISKLFDGNIKRICWNFDPAEEKISKFSGFSSFCICTWLKLIFIQIWMFGKIFFHLKHWSVNSILFLDFAWTFWNVPHEFFMIFFESNWFPFCWLIIMNELKRIRFIVMEKVSLKCYGKNARKFVGQKIDFIEWEVCSCVRLCPSW